MCGIAGIYQHDAHRTDARPEHILHAMLRTLIPRGPDDEGACEIKPRAGGLWHLGARRLAILDLSPAGHQPMRDAGTGNWVAHNGEVFNYRELREQLVAKGHAFRSDCDTEVILRGYE